MKKVRIIFGVLLFAFSSFNFYHLVEQMLDYLTYYGFPHPITLIATLSSLIIAILLFLSNISILQLLSILWGTLSIIVFFPIGALLIIFSPVFWLILPVSVFWLILPVKLYRVNWVRWGAYFLSGVFALIFLYGLFMFGGLFGRVPFWSDPDVSFELGLNLIICSFPFILFLLLKARRAVKEIKEKEELPN